MNKKVRTWVTLIAVTIPFMIWLLSNLTLHDGLGNSFTLFNSSYLSYKDFIDDFIYLFPCTNLAEFLFSHGATYSSSLREHFQAFHSLFLGLDFALWVNFGFFLIDFILWVPRALSKVFNKYEN